MSDDSSYDEKTKRPMINGYEIIDTPDEYKENDSYSKYTNVITPQ